jgi:glutaredoxin 3
MTKKRSIEVFSAGCSCCVETIELIRKAACPSCEVSVLDMRNPEVAERAARLGIRSVPAVVIDGRPADCCSARGPEMETLRAAGLGVPLM